MFHLILLLNLNVKLWNAGNTELVAYTARLLKDLHQPLCLPRGSQSLHLILTLYWSSFKSTIEILWILHHLILNWFRRDWWNWNAHIHVNCQIVSWNSIVYHVALDLFRYKGIWNSLNFRIRIENALDSKCKCNCKAGVSSNLVVIGTIRLDKMFSKIKYVWNNV